MHEEQFLEWAVKLFAALVIAVIGFSLTAPEDLTEQALQDAFNEGVRHGVCLTVKAQESADAIDECWEVKNDKPQETTD